MYCSKQEYVFYGMVRADIHREKSAGIGQVELVRLLLGMPWRTCRAVERWCNEFCAWPLGGRAGGEALLAFTVYNFVLCL